MRTFIEQLQRYRRALLQTSLAVFLFLGLSFQQCLPAWSGTLPMPLTFGFLAQGDAITDPNAILRYALPIDNDSIRDLQESLEQISKYLRGKRWSGVSKQVKSAAKVLKLHREDILASVPEADQTQAQAMIENIEAGMTKLEEALEGKDREGIWITRRELLAEIGDVEALMVDQFPFEVPEAYSNLPQLKGRATVEMKTTRGDMTIVVDGYSAPVNAGNFVDLVKRKFYDGLPFVRSDDSFVVQTGDPPGKDEGFIDPKTKKYRAIPLEVLVKGDELPIYGDILEDLGIYLPDLALPFNAYGAVALGRPDTDPNGGSSQFFFFRFDTELTPPGFNLMDGRYSVFGYVVKGKEVLDKLGNDDKVISAKVVEGLGNLVKPKKR